MRRAPEQGVPAADDQSRGLIEMTVLKPPFRRRPPRLACAAIALAVAVVVGVAAAWSPPVAVAVGVVVAVATLLLELLIWTEGDDDAGSAPSM
jgi:Flp pilus assembly protein TadB